MPSFEEILLWLERFFRRIAGGAILALLIALILKFLLPWLIKYLFGAAAVTTGMFIVALVIVIVFILIAIFDSGALSSGACSLRSYWFKPDECVKTTCPTTCISLWGPYPKAMGTWAPFKQAIGCICPASLSPLFSGMGPLLQALLDQALGLKTQSEIQRAIEKAIQEDGGDSEKARILIKLLEKMQRGEKLTPDDIHELERLGVK